MRTGTVLVVLMLLCMVPSGDASPTEEPSLSTHFEFDQTAAYPTTELPGAFVITSREVMRVQGAIVVERTTTDPSHEDKTLRPDAETDARQEEGEPAPDVEVLVRVDEEVGPGTTEIPFSLPVDRLGAIGVRFQSDEGRPMFSPRVTHVYGHAPVQVTIQDPAVNLVSVPDRPAELTVEITAMPGADLTDLRLSVTRFAEEVEVGNLSAGQQRTVTLTMAADGDVVSRSFPGRGAAGLSRNLIAPVLSGVADGEAFSHPLYRSAGDRLEPVRATIYVAATSTAFLLPPTTAALAVPTMVEVVILNVASEPMRVRGQVALTLAGMSHLRQSFDLDERVEADGVEIVRFDWTPPAAGDWQTLVEHDMHEYGRDWSTIEVAGPIAATDLRSQQTMVRGERMRLDMELTASEDIDVGVVTITTRNAPLQGVISIQDLFVIGSPPAMALDAGVRTNVTMDLTPKSTGAYDLYLVVDTPEGPSVHQADTVIVMGGAEGWLAWIPTASIVGLFIVHMAWRRRWVL